MHKQGVEFLALRSAPQFAEELAGWLHQERRRAGGAGSEAEGLAKLVEECSHQGQLPHTLLALGTGQLVGAVTLMQFKGPLAEPQTPWVTNLWVHPQWRRKGIGSTLCAQLCDYAKNLQFLQLQLFTHDQVPFYNALGWRTVRQTEIAGRNCFIMEFQL